MRVSSGSRVEFIASAVVARIKEKGSCVLESFGKVPAVISIKVSRQGGSLSPDRASAPWPLDHPTLLLAIHSRLSLSHPHAGD